MARRAASWAGHASAGCAAGVLTAAVLLAAPAAAQAESLAERIRAASPGDIVVVPAGIHPGPITVDRSITLQGEPGAILDGGGTGDVLRVTAAGATVRGLTLRATGSNMERQNAAINVSAPRVTVEDNVLEDVLFGIYLNEATHGVVRNNRIRGKDLALGRRGDAIRLWASDSVTIQGNDVAGCRDLVIWYCKHLVIRGNRVTHGRYGLHFMYAGHALLADNRLEDNSVGVYLMYSEEVVLAGNLIARNRGPSGFGLGLKDVDAVEARGNRFVANRVGIYIDNSPWSVNVYDTFEGNLVAYNDVGVTFLPAVRRNRFVGNAFVDNIEQIGIQAAGELKGNEFTVDGRGNFWSDYKGYDLANDGTGDVPYRSESLFENLMDREKSLRLFLFSPAQQAVELAAAALPAIKPRTKIEDAAPQMLPPALAGMPVASAARWPLALLAGLLGVSALATLRAGSQEDRRRESRRAAAGNAVTAQDAAAAGVEPAVRARGLRKRFGAFVALDDVDLEVHAGESVALWGRNGAGKTTAIRCLLGLHRFEGALEVHGLDVRRRGKDARRMLGYVPQELAFHDDPRTRETLQFYARLKRVPASRVDEVLAEVGMAEHADKRIRELSGGMKQRIALAAALLADPPILLLDEMTSNLDQAGRAGFLKLLAGLKHRGKTFVFTSHRLDEVSLLADRVVVLERGRVRRICAPADLADALGLTAVLRMRIDRGAHAAAAAALRAAGFEPSLNGGEDVRVRVPAGRKIEVLRVLEAAAVQARDFDVENVATEEPGESGGGL